MTFVKIGCQKAPFISLLVLVSVTLTGCNSGGSSGISSSAGGSNDADYGYQDFEVRDSEDNFAARQYSPYAAVLKDCILARTVADSCSLEKLPFIGDGTTTPTIDQIMDRTLVSHSWMALRFEQVLQSAPSSLLHLFSSATSIQISSKVRPSQYNPNTGSIYLDPNRLWTTVAEKRSIDTTPDFREAFGNDLQFWFLGSFRQPSGERLLYYYDLLDDSERPVEDIKLPTIRLLFHELVHATDFMPRHKIAGLDKTLSASDAIDGIRDEWLSGQLVAMHPLNSTYLAEFSALDTRGGDATDEQKATTAADVGNAMGADGAIQFYSYSSRFEDLSQLVTAVMMGYHYGATTSAAFVQKPADEDDPACEDLIVSWGQRNRLADPLVSIRARAAMELTVDITPELRTFMEDSLGTVEAMGVGTNWCENQVPTTIVASGLQARSAVTEQSQHASESLEMLRAEAIRHPVGVFPD